MANANLFSYELTMEDLNETLRRNDSKAVRQVCSRRRLTLARGENNAFRSSLEGDGFMINRPYHVSFDNTLDRVISCLSLSLF